MKLKLLLCIMLALALCAVSAGCESKPTITVYNWEDYIDPDIITRFQDETGITVEYVNFTTNEDMYIKLTRSNASYDVVFPSDYIIERLIKENMLEPLDKSVITNFAHLLPQFENPDYDPGNVYSAPYMWGTVGILYNTEMTGGPIDSWDAMWDVKYKDNVLMMASIRDTMGITMKKLGYSLNDTTPEHLDEVKQALIEQRESGVVLSYMVDEIKTKMVNGEAALGLVWSGDAVTSIEQNEALAYCVPKEGSNIWVDGMVIPTSAKNKEGAQKFIEFLMRPEIALANSRYIGYSTPNAAARGLMTDEERDDEVFNPPDDVVARCEFLHDIPADKLSQYEETWTQIKAQ